MPNDLSPQLSPHLNAEVQEALSNRYQTCSIVVPLSSGRFAVFSNARSEDSLIICSPDELHLVAASRANLRLPKPKPPNSPNSSTQQYSNVDLSSLL